LANPPLIADPEGGNVRHDFLDKVATSGYLIVMGIIKRVGIKDLKNNLSSCLRDVRQGTRIIVTDRSTVVAEIHEPGAGYTLPGSADPILTEWLEAGVLVAAIRKKTDLPVSPLRVEEGAARRLLDKNRDEERR